MQAAPEHVGWGWNRKESLLPLTREHKCLTQVSVTPACFRTQALPHLREAKSPPEKDLGQAVVVTCESMHAWMSSYPGPLHFGGTEIPGETSHTLSLLTGRRCSGEKLSVRQEQPSQEPTPEGWLLSYIISFEVHTVNIMNKEK